METNVAAGTGSLLINLKCPACGAIYNAFVSNTFCTKEGCNSTLFAQYDLGQPLDRLVLKGRLNSMWRYRELLPVTGAENIVTMGEGFTPIIPIKNLAKDTDGNLVYWKNEAGNPTGSFKARGIGMAVSKAKELGIKTIAIPTAGNAGGALAAYAARAGINAIVYMPKLTPQVFKDECRLYSARLIEVDGNIADCGKLVAEGAAEHGWFQISTLKEPYRLEGKKTMGFEIAEQFNWQLPDVVFYPTGGGTGLIGIWKAFDELEQLGWIGSKRPRMVAVQSQSCNGIVTAFNSGQTHAEFVDGGFTIANGLRVPKSFADKIILKVLRDSNGTALSISDSEMNDGVKEIARHEGMLIAPEGAALWQAYKKLKATGWIKPGETVVLVNTGSGYKYLENIGI
ncbi:threonine synthase [Mucilaginibacter phyllosphaerae]|uniref:Threonine synthase n=1 Tax=Mucilaginibacter phyllosphaerae TaxID=1812349 RepID=A0A4Y8ACY1_9SPHI|nr:threonine synthase [Mucilaginibacter phyllosphaerae]MBB3970127.1 threonine synthase [Mucilaginibacter phyllosphaerae]TEW66514.1 threonine synthase [Mucilaginibacter phyllosphaerae]GGH09941.1 threonine synthase [Mucilaginibacter phyllosphaerae]